MIFDFLGAIFSLISTYYFIQLNQKAWFVSIVATVLNGWLYWQKGIYADMALEGFYFLSTCYGLYLWQKPQQDFDKMISTLSWKQGLLLVPCTLIFFFIIVGLLVTFTHSQIAYLDALTTTLSLIAQWLMCHKIITTWVFWFFTDSLYAYIYLTKQLPFHTLLMLIYTLFSLLGYLRWTKMKSPLFDPQI